MTVFLFNIIAKLSARNPNRRVLFSNVFFPAVDSTLLKEYFEEFPLNELDFDIFESLKQRIFCKVINSSDYENSIIESVSELLQKHFGKVGSPIKQVKKLIDQSQSSKRRRTVKISKDKDRKKERSYSSVHGDFEPQLFSLDPSLIQQKNSVLKKIRNSAETLTPSFNVEQLKANLEPPQDDLLFLREKNQELIEQNESLSAQLQSLKERSEQEISNKELELKEKVQELTKQNEDILTQLNSFKDTSKQEMIKKKTKLKEKIQTLSNEKDDLLSKLNSFKETYDKENSKKDSKFEVKIQQLSKENESLLSKIESLKESYQQELSKKEKGYKNQVQQLSDQNESLTTQIQLLKGHSNQETKNELITNQKILELNKKIQKLTDQSELEQQTLSSELKKCKETIFDLQAQLKAAKSRRKT